jgi:hypothetical protein
VRKHKVGGMREREGAKESTVAHQQNAQWWHESIAVWVIFNNKKSYILSEGAMDLSPYLDQSPFFLVSMSERSAPSCSASSVG